MDWPRPTAPTPAGVPRGAGLHGWHRHRTPGAFCLDETCHRAPIGGRMSLRTAPGERSKEIGHTILAEHVAEHVDGLCEWLRGDSLWCLARQRSQQVDDLVTSQMQPAQDRHDQVRAYLILRLTLHVKGDVQ